MTFFIGVDIGGTTMRAARFDESLTLIERAERPTNPNRGVESILGRLLALIEQVYPESPDALTAIGIAAPGPLDPKTGVVLNPPNLPFRGTPVANIIQGATGVKTVIDNDANLAALAEHRLGAGQGTQNMLYLTLSTGLGSGLIINGELYYGLGQAGEAGYMIVAPGDPISGPDKMGYAEHISSGTALARRAQEAIEAGRESTLAAQLGEEGLTGAMVGEAAIQGDALAREIVRDAGHYAGILITSLLLMLQPERVVIGGSVAKIGDLIFVPLQEAVETYSYSPIYYRDTPIVRAELDNNAGLYGAALLAQQSGS